MKFDVPFYPQEDENDCGPAALKMVLEFFGEPHGLAKISGLVDSEKSGATWTLGLAKAAAELGFRTELYTKSLGSDPAHADLEFYKNLVDTSDMAAKLERLKIGAHRAGVVFKEKQLALNVLLSKLSEDCIAIILLDWYKVRGKEGYHGHFVPIVGYDEEHVYVHNQGAIGTQAFMPIQRALFDAARKAEGTDEDIVFVYRKK